MVEVRFVLQISDDIYIERSARRHQSSTNAIEVQKIVNLLKSVQCQSLLVLNKLFCCLFISWLYILGTFNKIVSINPPLKAKQLTRFFWLCEQVDSTTSTHLRCTAPSQCPCRSVPSWKIAGHRPVVRRSCGSWTQCGQGPLEPQQLRSRRAWPGTRIWP